MLHPGTLNEIIYWGQCFPAMPRFAILEHQQPPKTHWDFFLESGGVLRAWKLDEPLRADVALSCQSAPDHRLVYLDYEGPLTDQRGWVIRWDWGTYQLDLETPTELLLAMDGQRLRGTVRIWRHSPTDSQWQLLYQPVSR